MPIDPSHILAILDRCRDDYTFPMLDNGYVFLAATRLSLFRSPEDWSMVIEVFGFSPRSGNPDTTVQTFASRLHDRNRPDQFVSPAAHDAYLAHNPHNEFRPFFPIVDDSWQDEELVAERAREIVVRGRPIPLPHPDEYARRGIDLEDPPRVRVFEACRYLAGIARDLVLATLEERRVSVPPHLAQILQLEEWNHPDLREQSPGESETFQQLARVLATGDTTLYRPTLPPNTHWRHWPEGGTM